MGEAGKYETKAFLSSRLMTIDFCDIGSRKHYVQALVEFDVTEARKKIRERKRLSKDISFTAWLIKCIGSVCAEYKQIHGVRSGRRKIAVFDDVDISIVVEREVHGEKVPLPYVLRKANEKSISNIFSEIENAQNQPIHDEGDYVLGKKLSTVFMRVFYLFPAFLRRFFINRILHNPLLFKKEMGTVIVTSLGMAGKLDGWFVPLGVHPLIFAIGSINKKPGVAGDRIEVREHLKVTMLVDHDIVDGAPAARALSRLTKMIESGFGL